MGVGPGPIDSGRPTRFPTGALGAWLLASGHVIESARAGALEAENSTKRISRQIGSRDIGAPLHSARADGWVAGPPRATQRPPEVEPTSEPPPGRVASDAASGAFPATIRISCGCFLPVGGGW